jgi:hypothetical protein
MSTSTITPVKHRPVAPADAINPRWPDMHPHFLTGQKHECTTERSTP